MRMNTKADLKPPTIEKLQMLIQANLDSRDGYQEVAKLVDDAPLSALFQKVGQERAGLATELQQYVVINHHDPQDEGSVAAQIHRLWINIRGRVNGGDALPILIEAERGEDYIKAAYEDVLKETAGSPVNSVLQTHYQTVKSGHDRIRDLRDSLAATR